MTQCVKYVVSKFQLFEKKMKNEQKPTSLFFFFAID